MSWSTPARVEEALWQAARDVLPADVLATATLRAAVQQRSLLYTSERERLHTPPQTSADLAARALFFTVADAPKVMIPVAELRGRNLLVDQPRIVDIGAGCGAMTWGVWAALGSPAGLQVRAFDRDEQALDIMVRTGAELDVYVHADAADLRELTVDGEPDIVVVGSVLNELEDEDAAFDAIRGWIAALSPGGALIIVEPALREVSRRLHRLRDRLILAGRRIFAPCVRSLAPCPALADRKDWCHEDRPTDLPPRARELARATRLRQHGLKFSYLVVRPDGAALVESLVPAARVVSRVRKLKGKWEGFLCSDTGRQRTTLLRRDRVPGNRAFTELERGDVALGDFGARIAADSSVARWRPATSWSGGPSVA